MSNVFSFTGTVGRDAEVKQTPSGQSVLTVAVANNVGFGDKQSTIWVRVTLWGKRSEGQLASYLKKGQQVFVSGELTQNEYKSNDGTTKTALELNANVLDLVGKRNENVQQPAPAAAPQQQRAAQPPVDNFANFNDDIPF